MLGSSAQVYLVDLPYRGSAPALQDLIAGDTQVMFDNPPSALAHIKIGRLKALAVTSRRQSPALPEVAKMERTLGFEDFDATAWFGPVARAGTPSAIVNKIPQDMAQILATTEMRDRFSGQGALRVADSPEQFAAFIASEMPSGRGSCNSPAPRLIEYSDLRVAL